MRRIKDTARAVKQILVVNKKARNSDTYLYYLLCRRNLMAQGIDIGTISLKEALLQREEYGLPNFETVVRARRKVQSACPELAGDEAKEMRAENEKLFRSYAREVGL